MSKKEEIYDILKRLYNEKNKGITSEEIAIELKVDRSNISTYLNKLTTEDLVEKIKSRPVYFIPKDKYVSTLNNETVFNKSFSNFVGKRHSLKTVVEKAKAAMLYPTYGLHSIIYGETGVGKSLLAREMYDFSVEYGIRDSNSPFITFNCADYANNPQLLMGHIFGVEKGAYTGAENSRVGLLEGANGGVLFLDEIHRLPAEGQEMLFTFIDKGSFKRLGQATKEIKAEVLIIAATTENPKSTLLDTFNRRIPMVITIPPLRERSMVERIELVKRFFRAEAKKVNKPIKVHREIMKSLLLYQCKNNIGQLQSDIKLAVANSYLKYIENPKEILDIKLQYFGEVLKETSDDYKGKKYEVEILVPKDLDYYFFKPSGEEENVSFKEFYEEDNEESKAKLSIIGTGYRENVIIEEMFMDTKFFKTCESIRSIIEEELNITLSEKKFYYIALYIKSVIDEKAFKGSSSDLDINSIRQNNKEEFKIALKVATLIESEFNIFMPIEDVAYLTLVITKNYNENKEKDKGIEIIVAMHGEGTASSMVRAVKDILGEGNIYAFDMKLNKSYKECVEEFKETIKDISNKEGILLFTDMGSLNSFDKIVKETLKITVKSISMVTTLMVLEAVQKINIGFSLIEVYNSIMDMSSYNFKRSGTESINKINNAIIVGTGYNEGTDKNSKRLIKDKLSSYIEDIELIFLPYKTKEDLTMNVKGLNKDNNIIALVNDFPLESEESIDYINKKNLISFEEMEKLKTLIRINKGYYDMLDGLRSSLKYTSCYEVLEDTKKVIDRILYRLNIKKQYDMYIGFTMHMAFMIDGLVGNVRKSEVFKNTKLKSFNEEVEVIREELKGLERKYSITIDINECYGILYILYDDI